MTIQNPRGVRGGLVGGGLFSTVRLEHDEPAIVSLLASRPGWLDKGGYLTVTDRRIIYTPYRWPLIGHPRVFLFSGVIDVEASRKRNLLNPVSFFADSVVIRLRNSHDETFLPAMRAAELLQLIKSRLVP